MRQLSLQPEWRVWRAACGVAMQQRALAAIWPCEDRAACMPQGRQDGHEFDSQRSRSVLPSGLSGKIQAASISECAAVATGSSISAGSSKCVRSISMSSALTSSSAATHTAAREAHRAGSGAEKNGQRQATAWSHGVQGVGLRHRLRLVPALVRTRAMSVKRAILFAAAIDA